MYVCLRLTLCDYGGWKFGLATWPSQRGRRSPGDEYKRLSTKYDGPSRPCPWYFDAFLAVLDLGRLSMTQVIAVANSAMVNANRQIGWRARLCARVRQFRNGRRVIPIIVIRFSLVYCAPQHSFLSLLLNWTWKLNFFLFHENT